MNVRLQKYALLAEIIGGVSIAASLLFVGFQIKQNSITVQAQTRLAMTEQARDNIKHSREAMILERNATYIRVDEVTLEEIIDADMNINLMRRGAENVFYQDRVGTFSEQEFEGYKNFYMQQFSSARFQDHWAIEKTIFSKDFQNDVDNIISEL